MNTVFLQNIILHVALKVKNVIPSLNNSLPKIMIDKCEYLNGLYNPGDYLTSSHLSTVLSMSIFTYNGFSVQLLSVHIDVENSADQLCIKSTVN